MNILKFIKKTKFFTLIELIVVIVVLGILAAIVVPNISSFKDEADHKAILSNARNIQTSVDMFTLENHGATPTKETPSLGNPQVIQVYGLQPDYLRTAPKVKGVKYWLDHNNTVWASTVDAPQKVEFISEVDGTTKLTWETVDGAKLYKIYTTDNAVTANVSTAKGMKFVDDLEPLENITPEISVPELSKGTYLVTAVDKYDFETAPTKMNSSYSGYLEPEKDFVLSTEKVPANQIPVAVISMNPSTNIDTSTNITWKYDLSTDAENDDIVEAEWILNGTIKNTPNGVLPAGSYKMELRVKDSKGNWSNKVEKTFEVKNPPIKYTNGSLSLAMDGDNSTYVTISSGTDLIIDPSLGGKKLGILSRAESTCYVSDVTGYAMYKGNYNFNNYYNISSDHYDPNPKYGTITLPVNVDALRFLQNEGCNSGKPIKLYEITILN